MTRKIIGWLIFAVFMGFVPFEVTDALRDGGPRQNTRLTDALTMASIGLIGLKLATWKARATSETEEAPDFRGVARPTPKKTKFK